MVLKNDWVDQNTPGHTEVDWTFTAAAANLVADQVNTNTSAIATGSVAALAAWYGRLTGTRKVPARHTFWGESVDNATPPTVDDTGQSTTHTTATSGDGDGADPVLAGGRWTSTPTGTGSVSTYRNFAESTPVERIGVRFSFDDEGGTRTTNGPAAALVMSNASQADFAESTTRLAAHLIVNPTYWELQKYNAATTTWTSLKIERYAKLATDGTLYETEMYRSGDTVTVVGPDGKIVEVTDSDIDAFAGNWGWVEVFVAVGDTDPIPGIAEYWADPVVLRPPTNALTTRKTVENLIDTTTAGWTPADYGLLNWTHDPGLIGSYFSLAGYSGQLWLVAIPVRYPQTVTNVHLGVQEAGSGLTSGQNFAALYQFGNLLAATADQTTAWGTAGMKTMALTAPQVVVPGEPCYVGFYSNGTTPPKFYCSPSALQGDPVNWAGIVRHGLGSAGLTTAPPATITPSASQLSFWAALS